jgi:hypothetical protein
LSDHHEPQHDHNLNVEVEVNADTMGEQTLTAEVDINEDNIVRKICTLLLASKIQMVMTRKISLYLILEHGRILTILKGIC